jgi:hypothetical protein
LVASRACKATTNAGRQCAAPPLRDGDFCRLHDLDLAEVVQEARRLGGIRRKRETTLAVAYEFDGLRTIDDIQRFVEVAGYDAIGLDPSVNKVRAMGYIAQVAMSLLKEGELQDVVDAIEGVLIPRIAKPESRSRRWQR